MTELYTSGFAVPKAGVRMAERAEAEGWDGFLFTDSQNLQGDPYVALGLAARATRRIMLGTGVTNPVTRHPAVAASAIATIQAESGGRAVLGIGRGDSSLAYIGRAPAPVEDFEDYLRRLQAYLSGGAVRLDDGDVPAAERPADSRLEWLRPDQPKVPVDVAATGPKVIAAAARHAERITFAVGADPDRLSWAVESARAATPAGENRSLGAWVNVVCHDDPAAAFDLGRGAITSFARFSVMHGTATGPVTEDQRSVLERIPEVYDMTHHFRSSGRQAAVMTPDFADRYAILGPPEHCIERLRELSSLGLERFVVIGPAMDGDREEARRSRQRFVEEVLPVVSSPRS